MNLWLLDQYYLHHSLLNSGKRVSLRYKVSESLISGITMIDACIPIGKGQRQLIIGDRGIGKTSIFIMIII